MKINAPRNHSNLFLNIQSSIVMKNIMFCCCAFFAASFLASPLFAQEPLESPQPPTEYQAKGLFKNKCTLSSGTLVILETTERLSSDQATVGKTLQFRVRTDVMAERETAIRSGALAIGRVKAIEPATHNNPEEIRIELQYVQAVDGQMVPLSGQEQSLHGQYSGQGTTVEPGASIMAFVMNDQKIKVD